MGIKLKQTIENALYSYDMNEFQPIFRDGELDNKGEFVAYKAEKAIGVLGHLAARTFAATVTAGEILLEHMDAAGEV